MTERADLLVGGLQIQSRKKSKGIGTLGCIVFDKQTGKALGLTNRHILKKRRGFSVIQPALKRRSDTYTIGKILRKGGRGRSNDFAVFEIDLDNRSFDAQNSIAGLEGKLTEIAVPEKGMKVQKVGQRTGHTFGIIAEVTSTSITIVPNPDKLPRDEAGKVSEISKGGDSGALWVTDEANFKAVGLHRAGEPDGSPIANDKAFAIPMARVMRQLQIRF